MGWGCLTKPLQSRWIEWAGSARAALAVATRCDGAATKTQAEARLAMAAEERF